MYLGIHRIRERSGAHYRSPRPPGGGGHVDRPTEELTVGRNGRQLPLNRQRLRTTNERGAADQGPHPSPHGKIQLTKSVRIPAFTQAYVEVRTAKSGLIHISPKDALFSKRRVCLANGIHEVEADVPFRVLISNFSCNPER